MIPNITGLNDSEKIEVIIKVINSILLKKESELPVGTCIMRHSEEKNAGFKYGTWLLIEDKVSTSNGVLMIYVRTE